MRGYKLSLRRRLDTALQAARGCISTSSLIVEYNPKEIKKAHEYLLMGIDSINDAITISNKLVGPCENGQ